MLLLEWDAADDGAPLSLSLLAFFLVGCSGRGTLAEILES